MDGSFVLTRSLCHPAEASIVSRTPAWQPRTCSVSLHWAGLNNDTVYSLVASLLTWEQAPNVCVTEFESIPIEATDTGVDDDGRLRESESQPKGGWMATTYEREPGVGG
eukprot:scaffold1987_cov377-Prasinococcus_capsulatus_cf.AAC.2